MPQIEIVVVTKPRHDPVAENGEPGTAMSHSRRGLQWVAPTEIAEVVNGPSHHECLCMAHPRRGSRRVARETFLPLAISLVVAACHPTRDRATRATDATVSPQDVPRGSPGQAPPPPTPARTDRWSGAYSATPLDAAELRTLLAEAALPEGDGAALTLGRRAPLTELNAIDGTLPHARLDPFLRGLSGRPIGISTLPETWRRRWTLGSPSIALATLIGKNAFTLDAPSASLSESLLIDGDLPSQIAGARSLQNASVPLPGIPALTSLHPVAFPLAMRSLALRGGVPSSTWIGLIATVASRVHTNPRSWSSAWVSLMEAAPTTDPAIQAAMLGVETVVTQIDLQPTGVIAAYRCAVALRYDRLDQGRRTETCATGADEWRSLAALAERARPPLSPEVMADQLRALLVRGGSDPKVLEPIAEASVLLPPPNARPIIVQLIANRDPGVLAALLEALHAHPRHARALPPPVLDRLLRAPFELPEAPSIEARLHAIELRQELNLPPMEASPEVRALRQAALPDAAVVPASTLVSPPSAAETWVLETTAGVIRIALRADTAPEALRLLTETSLAGSYRHTTFHRVVPGFVAQGGDPRGDGYGGTTRIVPTELSGARFERGAVGVALAGLDTGGTQFFITLTDSPHLDARYPYLGQVVSGMDVADRLMSGDEIISDTIVATALSPSEP